MAGVIALTGATGYVGGRLLYALEARGERVRCLSRRPEYLSARVGPGTEVVEGDVDHRDSVLNEEERASNEFMMICVSRCKSKRLVLDI